MSGFKFFGKLAAGVLGLAMILNAPGQVSAEGQTQNQTPAPTKKIVINSASRFLTLYEGDKKIAMYPLGLGKVWTPTPVGYFTIETKEVNPSWIDPRDPEYEIPSGPSNPLGYRWMRIRGNYGIHGTNRPESIGHYVSNGCIRMLEENVEDLFDRVEIGTPVEITYNRVVVEKAPDGNVVYYIYPDGYERQKLNADYVAGWIEPFGVLPFETVDSINQKIKNSDGNPTYLGKPYNIEVNGKILYDLDIEGRKFFSKAVTKDKITYLPAVPLAMALNEKMEWRAAELTVKTDHGEVTGYEKRKQIYINADDAGVLFNIEGGLQNVSGNPDAGKIFRYQTVQRAPEPIEEIIETIPVEEVSTPPEQTEQTDKDKKKDKKKKDKDKKKSGITGNATVKKA